MNNLKTRIGEKYRLVYSEIMKFLLLFAPYNNLISTNLQTCLKIFKNFLYDRCLLT